MRWIGLVVVLAFSGAAHAQQLKWEVDKGGGAWAFNAVWKDSDGVRQQARFTLPADAIKEDLEQPLYQGLGQIQKVAIHDINTHDFGKGVRCTAEKTSRGMSVRCKASTDAKLERAYAESQQILDDRQAKWLSRHGFIELDDGTILIDWAQHVRDYAAPLAPVVAGLGGPTPDPRDFARRALGFVQSIPYEQRGSKPDKYRRPLSILGRNRGDCDSKTVLYLALMHQAYPELGLGVVVIRGHAFGALALTPAAGDRTVKVNEARWVAVEPVGPALFDAGEVGRPSKRALRRRRYTLVRAT